MTATAVGASVWPPPVDVPRSSEPTSRHHPPRVSSRTPSPHSSTVVAPPSHLLVLVPIRIFLAAGWLRAGIEKLIDGEWWNGDNLRAFLDVHRPTSVPPFRPIMEHAIQPFAVLVAFVVMATEIACAIAIGTGRAMRAALRWAVVLNVAFVLCGPVNPSAFYLVMEIVLLVAIADGTIGTRPTKPSGRTYALAGALLLVAALLSPYIRTIEPAKVISDPAVMLVFLAVLAATTLVLRCVFASSKSAKSRSIWSEHVTVWVLARPRRQSSTIHDRTAGGRPAAPDLVSAVGWTRSA